tara:strand:+ start:994 stop:1467 length:474 start_codon:yes stop_codon:yes gene_type:complete
MYAKGHSEAVINTCDTCRRVAIQRRRVGASGAPVMRTYDLQPKSKFSLPFKGPGRSRVTSDVPCRGDLGGGSDLLNPGKGQRKNTQKQCVYLQGTKNNKVLLINRCSRCRAAAVARYSRSGKSLGRQFYKLAGGARTRIAPKGAARVGYLIDIPCPS